MSTLLGSAPNQVPTNGDLGTLAFQDSNAAHITGGNLDGVTLGTTCIVKIPSADPHVAGALWVDGSTVKVSAG